jgi:rod shape determining protein RodA
VLIVVLLVIDPKAYDTFAFGLYGVMNRAAHRHAFVARPVRAPAPGWNWGRARITQVAKFIAAHNLALSASINLRQQSFATVGAGRLTLLPRCIIAANEEQGTSAGVRGVSTGLLPRGMSPPILLLLAALVVICSWRCSCPNGW